MGPAEAAADRPIDEAGFADDLFFGEIAPVTRIVTVHGVITHDEVMIGSNLENVGL